MTQYLRIASPGVADPMALTILGVGSSRYSENTDTIGMFSTGSKLATALLLRNWLPPVYILGNLKMQYGIKPIIVGGREFQQVYVKYSGSDSSGRMRSSTEDLGYTTDMGSADWNDLTMAPREYVANAIDSVLQQKLPLWHVEIGVVDNIRAKRDWTQVYIPVNQDILRFYSELNTRFLHFGRKELLNQKLLPKKDPNENRTRIYKKGVLVSILPTPSVWDYNLGNELRLDESRNAHEYTVKYAIAKALAYADSGALGVVIRHLATSDKKAALVEASLASEYLEDLHDIKTKDTRKEQWKKAFHAVAGDKGVAASGLADVASHIKAKGYNPLVLPQNWLKALQEYDVPTEDKILTASEKAGEVLSEPTKDMLDAVDKIWSLLEEFKLTNNKEKPRAQAFMKVMNAGAQQRGEYRDGVVLLHTDLTAGPLLMKVALEEVVHHVTGAGDMSRDLQDFLFRLVVAIVW